jgi:hypothetical protein
MHRIAVPVDAGVHVVRLLPSRLTFRIAIAVALLTAIGLVLYVSGTLRRRSDSAGPAFSD